MDVARRCVYVCVRERERDREIKKREKEWIHKGYKNWDVSFLGWWQR